MDLTEVTEKTLEKLEKAATTGVTSSSGITGVDLSDLVSLIPVNTPFFDSLAHETPKMGGPLAMWKSLVNVNNQQARPTVAFDDAGPLALLQELDVSEPYGAVAEGYKVTRDAIALAGGYADAKAIAITNALNIWKISMDKVSLGGQRFALQTPGTPTVSTSTTGGSIPTATAVPVKVAARTLSGYYWGGSTVASAQGSVTTGAGGTNSATASVVSVQGAVAYDWFVNGFYYTTTTVNKVVITSIPVANQAVPNLPNLYTTAPAIVPVVDGSAVATDFNGLLASLTGDYATGGATGQVTHGSGTASGASIMSLDGAGFTGSGQNINELDALNQLIYNAVNLSPDAYMVSSQTASEISTDILGSASGASTYYTPNLDGRTEAVAGAFVGWYINKAAGGKPVKIEVQPNLPQGVLVARTDTVPFPNSGISRTLALRDLDPVYTFEYGTARVAGAGQGGGPREEGENRTLTALINRAPVAMGVIHNIG